MISEAELWRLAARSGVDPMVQDLDYALGWFLVGLLRHQDIVAGPFGPVTMSR